MSIAAHRFKRSSLQLTFLISFLAGIGLARKFSLSVEFLPVLLLATAVVWRKQTILTLILITIFGCSLGVWRGSLFMHKLAAYAPYYTHKISLTVTANQDAVYGMHSQLTFDGGNVRLDNGRHLAGKISVSGFGSNTIFQGDTVRVTGKLRPGFGSKQGTISYAIITVQSHHNSLIAEIRRRFAAGMQTALPEPLGSFAMGLLIGQRATLPASVKKDLLMVGLTHIIAVSGYNLTIMLHASKRLFAGQSKRLATMLSFILIATFLLLAGSSASIIRAAIVSTLSIVTTYYGRSLPPLNLLAVAAVITAWANPFYVWSDISWYLSFLAFFGVMILAPLLAERLPFKHKDSALVAVGIESLCAEAMSLPIVLYIFGQMSLIGLPANVLVVALVPLAMLLCTCAGLAGMFVAQIAGIVAWPAKILLNYMLDTAHMLANVPNIFVEQIGLSLTRMLLWYGATLIFVGALWYKSRSKSDTITDREH